MAHLLGLRAATAAGAHFSTYRGCWGRVARQLRHSQALACLCEPFSSVWFLDTSSLARYVDRSPAVPDEAKKAFRLFADDLQIVAHRLSLWGRIVTRLAVEAHVASH
eukprot:s8158_g2.t1